MAEEQAGVLVPVEALQPQGEQAEEAVGHPARPALQPLHRQPPHQQRQSLRAPALLPTPRQLAARLPMTRGNL